MQITCSHVKSPGLAPSSAASGLKEAEGCCKRLSQSVKRVPPYGVLQGQSDLAGEIQGPESENAPRQRGRKGERWEREKGRGEGEKEAEHKEGRN